MSNGFVFLCPGQGAQAVGMGQAWASHSPAAASIRAPKASRRGSS